ncbi:uncharacterized protein LOC144123367 [Amblyomma americanum]
MDGDVTKKRRKRYFYKDEPFVVPKTTLYRRQQEVRLRAQHCASSTSAANDGDVNGGGVVGDLLNLPSGEQPAAEQAAQPASPTLSAHDEQAGGTSYDDDEDLFQTDDFDRLGETPQDSSSMPGETENDDGEREFLASDFVELEAAVIPGSTTTKAAAIIMIMAFVVTHGLTWEALNDLLRLIDGLFGFKGDVLPRSKFVFRKLWSSRKERLVKRFFYCDTCGSVPVSVPGMSSMRCPDCEVSTELCVLKARGHFFIILDLKEQMKCLLAKSKAALFERLVNLKAVIQQGGAALLQDITSGSMAEELRKSGKIGWMDLTITINTDGSPVFKSSSSSVWPIQFLINELPPCDRLKNCLIGGLWFGQHPYMRTFLTKFVEEINQFGKITWKAGHTLLSSGLHVLCCCVDAPARASVINMVQFNGLFGCPWCYNCAEFHEGAQRYMSVTVGEERTPGEMSKDMEFAEKIKDAVNGLKGQSPLNHLKHFNIVFGHTVEYMHCVLIGVTKCLTDQWFDSANSQQPFYIGRPVTMAKVDRRLLAIKPPHSFTRLPRSLKDKCHWKASEWRHWLLFYALPCCLGILPQRYLNHFALLVEAIFTLLLEELTLQQINHAGRLLEDFVSRMPALYGARLMTFNVHQLLHLAKAAKNFGPLWAHSAFVFETGNGRVLRAITSANGAPDQVIERMIMLQQVDLAMALCTVQEQARNFICTMLGHPLTLNATRVGNSYMFGACDPFPVLSTEEKNSLMLSFGYVPSLEEHFRFSFRSTVLHSTRYERAKKSNSTAICTTENDFFVINRIFQVTENETRECILLCTKVVCMESQHKLPPHIMECFRSLSGVITVLKLKDIHAPCVLIEFAEEEGLYICKLPNFIERD